MKNLALPASIISDIVDDPASLASPSSIGLTSSTASYILNHGYTKGFRSLFILNACLAVVATLASIAMIRHKELTRDDEAALRQNSERESKKPQDHEETPQGKAALPQKNLDIELRDIKRSNH